MLNRIDKALARPDRVYRLAGLISCAVTGINLMFTHLYVGPSSDMAGLIDVARRYAGLNSPEIWTLAVDLSCFCLFGWAFWRAMDSKRLLAPDMMSVYLLGLQVLLGLLTSPALFFIVVSEACFLLKPRRASALTLALTLTGVLTFLAMPEDAAASSAAAALFGVTQPPRGVGLLIQCLMFPMILLFSYCLGLLGATEWRNRRELARINAELKATQQLQAESARLAERVYISRELHDAIGHHLAALSVNLQLASHLTEGEAAESIREAHLVARTLLADVREVVSSLRQEATIDLRAAIETLASGVKHPTIHVEINDELKDTDPLQAHTIFRCAQEIITNTIRHAGARNLWLTLELDDTGISLQARDDGRGAEKLQPGNGLRGMRERVEEYGGHLNWEARLGAGFSAVIFLPFAGGTR
ncbi:MAG: sensor histidine kinase [Acidobacteria bacterium]|nr:sensor histidine kinase [Acidobacteriota bacterium]